jgi:Ankyrin repeats (3 copies)
MDAIPLPPRPNLEQYKKRAKDLVKACKSRDQGAIRAWARAWIETLVRLHSLTIGLPGADDPERRDPIDRTTASIEERVKQGNLATVGKPSTIATLANAQFFIARAHGFESWPKFAKHLQALNRETAAESQFEAAVEAIVAGDLATLQTLLQKNPQLSRARSTRTHRATLLHYVSANGVEDYRQRSPKNAVEVAKILLDAGAEVDAEANMYGGRDKTLGLVVTSIWPAKAGVLVALIELLLDAGAVVDGGDGPGGAVNACLHNGRPEGAAILARHGASLDLEAAAGVGRLDVVKSFFNEDGSLKPTATKAQMEAGFMWACEFGQTRVVEFLLDRGLDPGTQVHGMGGLHWAMVGGHLDTIKLLLARGVPLEAKNVYGGTALGAATWAVIHSDPVYRWPKVDTDWTAIIRTLLESGANVYEADYPTGNEGVDEVLRRALARMGSI